MAEKLRILWGKMRLKTRIEFIQDAQEVHGLKYDYSESVYLGNKTKLIITCPEHGRFEQTPSGHIINKSGCPECGQQVILKKCNRRPVEEFVEKAREIHGDSYTYQLVEYSNSRTKVKITCKKHGDFEQTPNAHLNGHRCKRCSDFIRAKQRTKTKEQFIKEANKKHLNRYSYENLIYRNSKHKVKITCKKHGDFEQIPSSHLSGRGCPKCSKKINDCNYVNRYTLNEELGSKPGIFYVVEFTHHSSSGYEMFSFIKVGITSKTIKERYVCCEHGGKNDDKLSYKVHLELKMSNLSTALLERAFFNEHPPDFAFPEGFKFGGKTECYKIENFKFEWLKGLECLK